MGSPIVAGYDLQHYSRHPRGGNTCIVDWPPVGSRTLAVVSCLHERLWIEGADWGPGHGDACEECCKGECSHPKEQG